MGKNIHKLLLPDTVKVISLTAIAVFSLVKNIYCEESFLIYSASEITEPPIIDGKLYDTCWQRTEKTSPMVAIGGKKVQISTQGMLCWDKENLYIALICEESQINIIKDEIAKGIVSPYRDFNESIEIFIDPKHDHYNYFQFRVSIIGERDSRRRLELDTELNKKWYGAVYLNKDTWNVEVAIPFKYLDSFPSSSSIFGLNLNRQNIIREDKWTCWSDTKGGFHAPGRFGHLIFAGYSIWLKSYFDNQIYDIDKEIKNLFNEYPESTFVLKDKVVTVKKEYENFLQSISVEKIDKCEKCASFYVKGNIFTEKYEKVLSELRLAIIKNEFK